MHKRRSFDYERELRAVIQELPIKEQPDGGSRINYEAAPYERGVPKTIAVEQLLENIYVSPGSPSWFLELVNAVTRRYGVTPHALQSNLDRDPVY
jgi:hypothetical protein